MNLSFRNNSNVQIIFHSSSVTGGEFLLNPADYETFSKIRELNDSATSVSTMYCSVPWKDETVKGLARTLTTTINGSIAESVRNKLMEAYELDSVQSINETPKGSDISQL